MKEKNYEDNYLSHSIDITKRRKNRKLEIIVEENNSISHDINKEDMSGLKTQENKYNNYNRFKHPDSSENKDNFERRKKNNDWNGKKRQISKYSQSLDNSDEEESEEKEFYKIEDNSDKKRRNQKVSQNLQLLKLIKERFNNSGKKGKEKEEKSQEKKKKEINEEKNDDGNNNYNEKNGYINQRKKYLKRKGFATFIINKKNDDDIANEKTDTKIIENQNKRYNKFKKREIDNSFKEEEQKEENAKLNKSRSKRIINSNDKITHSVISSVSYSSITRKAVGNFQISRPKLKSDSRKNEEKAREEEIKDEQELENKNKNKKEDKYTEITEIPNEQKDKLTINIKPKNINSMNEINNNSGKKNYQKNITNKRDNYAYDRDDDDIKANDDECNNNNNDNNNDSNNNGSEYYEYNKEGYQIKKASHKMKEIDRKNMNKRSNMQENNNDSPNKLNKKSINPNKSNFNSSSKKDFALKILEILKAKKREEPNKNELRAKSQDIPLKQDKSNKNSCNEDENEENKTKDKGDILRTKINKIETDYNNISNQKTNKNYPEGKFDSNSLPKKTFREEEEEEEEFKKDYKYQESNYKVQTPDSYMKQNYNRMENRKNHINMNRSMNLNKYLDFDEAQNGREKRFSNYIINSSSLRTKYNKKIKESNKTNDSSSINKSYEPKNFDTQNTTIVKSNYNIKSLDKSFDNAISRKSPIAKRILNMNNPNNDKYNSIKLISNSGVYEHKKISSPSNERNLNNELNCINSMKNIKKKVYNKMNSNNAYMAYVKKSPGRFKRAIQNNYDSNDNNKNEKNYNLKNNLYKNYIDNNISNNNLNTKFSNNKNSITGLLEVSSIDKFNTSKDTCTSNTIDYFNYNYIDKKNKINNNNKNNLPDMSQRESSMMFNLEDLMVLEERLSDINIALQSNNNIESKCFNFWNYYYNCSLYKIIEKIFPNEEDSNIVRLSINYELMSIMVCYEFSFHAYITYEDMYLQLLDLINLNHNNLMIICEYILTKISPENKKNIWVTKLQELVNNLKISQVKELNNNYSLSSIQKINNNTKNLIPKIKNILRNYTTEFSPFLKKFLNTLESKSYEEINEFFRLNILRVNNFEGSIVASSYLKENKNFEPVPAPYITEPNKKKYTLVLDLDETLVNFKIKSTKEGMLRARPFLFGFLEEMGVYYELIIWTSATEAYANTLLDAIESEKTYFDYVFYREHAIIVGDDFVKDLTRIGRPLDKIIIVDDMPQNFRLQRQNGITIKPFLGDDNTDMALYDLLPILKHIAEEGKDVRIELAKYRDEIVKKITSNISKHNI